MCLVTLTQNVEDVERLEARTMAYIWRQLETSPKAPFRSFPAF